MDTEMNLLTNKQKEELQKLAELVQQDAELVIKDYKETPSDMSGSITQIHIDSPLLEENEK
jgi:hypothetical protein